jgi:hypothetical protein
LVLLTNHIIQEQQPSRDLCRLVFRDLQIVGHSLFFKALLSLELLELLVFKPLFMAMACMFEVGRQLMRHYSSNQKHSTYEVLYD